MTFSRYLCIYRMSQWYAYFGTFTASRQLLPGITWNIKRFLPDISVVAPAATLTSVLQDLMNFTIARSV